MSPKAFGMSQLALGRHVLRVEAAILEAVERELEWRLHETLSRRGALIRRRAASLARWLAREGLQRALSRAENRR